MKTGDVKVSGGLAPPTVPLVPGGAQPAPDVFVASLLIIGSSESCTVKSIGPATSVGCPAPIRSPTVPSAPPFAVEILVEKSVAASFEPSSVTIPSASLHGENCTYHDVR